MKEDGGKRFMYKILNSAGKLVEATTIIPIVEKVFEFNGKKRRMIEKVTNLKNHPNGLLIFTANQNAFVGSENDEYIGNISSEKVEEVLRFLLKNGYYDFSTWEYQETEHRDELIFDDGQSKAYTSKITKHMFPLSIREHDVCLSNTIDLSCIGEIKSDDEDEIEWSFADENEDNWSCLDEEKF